MPDAGFDNDGGSWFTNWVDHRRRSARKWETFHVDQLIPWVDANLRTIATRRGRAIAGLSQGGFGAMSYAARHPDLFVSVGVVLRRARDRATRSLIPQPRRSSVRPRSASTASSRTPCSARTLTHEINWQGHDPATLVTQPASASTSSCGPATASPGPHDTPGTADPSGLADRGDRSTSRRNSSLRPPTCCESAVLLRRLRPGHAHLAVLERDLTQYLPRLARVFASTDADRPRSATARSTKTWTQWGWTVADHRGAKQAWNTLRQAGPSRFALRDGRRVDARVTTPQQLATPWSGRSTCTSSGGSRSRSRRKPGREGGARCAWGQARRDQPADPLTGLGLQWST